MARLLPPESAALEVVAREVGIGVGTLEKWREDAQSRPARGRAWTAGARLEAVITTAAMNEAAKSAWCRERGVYPAELDKWRASCTTALADPEDARASPQATRSDRKRIKAGPWLWQAVEVVVYGCARCLRAVAYPALWPTVLGPRSARVV